MKLKIKRLSKDALLPTRKYPGDAGYDLFSPNYFVLEPEIEYIIPLGIAVEIPKGCFGLIKEKGGTENLMIGAGVIDSNYSGELKLKVRTFGHNYRIIGKHQPIAQLIICVYFSPEVEEVEELSETERGEKGGINKL